MEDTGALIDVPAVDLHGVDLPQPPAGYEIDRVELVIRVRPTRRIE
jgi:hypothetical protein